MNAPKGTRQSVRIAEQAHVSSNLHQTWIGFEKGEIIAWHLHDRVVYYHASNMEVQKMLFEN